MTLEIMILWLLVLGLAGMIVVTHMYKHKSDKVIEDLKRVKTDLNISTDYAQQYRDTAEAAYLMPERSEEYRQQFKRLNKAWDSCVAVRDRTWKKGT